jgi:hypothetical protein
MEIERSQPSDSLGTPHDDENEHEHDWKKGIPRTGQNVFALISIVLVLVLDLSPSLV